MSQLHIAPRRVSAVICVLLAALCVATSAPAQTPAAESSQLLWPDGAPGAVGSGDDDRPSIAVYLPPAGTATGTAALIFPGGGYDHLAVDKEGTRVAQWLNHLGVTAFVVRYRLGPRYHYPAMLEDAIRSVRVVRAHAAEWHVDPKRIGVVGFSAGGHMASTAGTHFDSGDPANADSVERVSSRPDFMVLAYPVITMRESYAHQGSRLKLLGEHPSPELIRLFSNETRVTHDTPPAFIVATNDDATVPIENSLMLFQALHDAGVPAELHVFQHGRHGFGLAPNDPVLSRWPALCAAWLQTNGWLRTPTAR